MNDRQKWKNAIEKGSYDPQCASLAWADMTIQVKCSHENESLSEIISNLSKALLQIEQSVERRFIDAPLGDLSKNQENKNRKQKKIKQNYNEDSFENHKLSNEQNKWQTLLNWEKSLMNCTNLSQLFIHFQSLDESITWSKSCLNARCKICRKKGDADKMLLCDKCDRGHHIYCLRPVLKVYKKNFL